MIEIETTLNSLKEIKKRVESEIDYLENFISASLNAPSAPSEAIPSTQTEEAKIETVETPAVTEAPAETVNAEAVVPATDPFNGATS